MYIAILYFSLFFLYGVVIGSFLNVCIFRIPKHETIVTTPSHCMTCGERLKWYELIPLFSYLFQRGKCRHCGVKLSPQYPIVEGLNGLFYMVILYLYGIDDLSSVSTTAIYCLMFSTLLALSIIDFRTYEIPIGFNIFLLILGIAKLVTHLNDWSLYVIGFFAVSIPLLLIYLITKGKGIGGGDVKLMAVCGLIVGWKLILLSLMIGCILGAVIHLCRMKISGEGRVLAMGPYLSAGIMLSVLFGPPLIGWYVGLFGM